MKDFTLYWSSLELFEACPQKFLWSRGWGSIDLGRGPGRGKERPVKDSKHHAIMGIAIQRVVEKLYNDELWRTPVGLQEKLEAMVEKELLFEIARNFIDWRLAPAKAEMLDVCRKGVSGYLRTMKAQKLLGPYAKAEVELLGWVNKYTPVGGRADLIVGREDTGVTIIDGKNGQTKGKYTTPDQLRWYALCYYLVYGKLPDRVGFAYYRYPAGMPKEDGGVEDGVDWETVTRLDIEGLARRAVDVRKSMDKEKFTATPSPAACRFCEYETVCEARKAQKAANSRGKRKKPGLVDEALSDGAVFVELKF